jgi:hypothetical protein
MVLPSYASDRVGTLVLAAKWTKKAQLTLPVISKTLGIKFKNFVRRSHSLVSFKIRVSA